MESIKTQFQKEPYDLCLFNTSTTTTYFDMEMAVLSKPVYPDVFVGTLVVHPLAEPKETLLM